MGISIVHVKCEIMFFFAHHQILPSKMHYFSISEWLEWALMLDNILLFNVYVCVFVDDNNLYGLIIPISRYFLSLMGIKRFYQLVIPLLFLMQLCLGVYLGSRSVIIIIGLRLNMSVAFIIQWVEVVLMLFIHRHNWFIKICAILKDMKNVQELCKCVRLGFNRFIAQFIPCVNE